MSSAVLVDVASGRRVLLVVQNQGTDEIGLSFDGPKNFPTECAIILQGGGSIMFDRVVPQNRLYGVSNSLSAIPVGVTVANVS